MIANLWAGVIVLLSQQYYVYCRGGNYYYDSFGPNILFNDEGAAVQTASGKDFLSGVSADTCADACYKISRKCGCCNSFAYNPNNQMCYLKKRSNEGDLSRYTDSNGYQSYKFQGFSFQYDGELPNYVMGTPNQFGTAGIFDMAFISMGNSMNALNEGFTLKTSKGFEPFTNMTPAKCGDLCLQFEPSCAGFVFNPNQDGGKCYLKTGDSEKYLEQKFQVQYNSEGWTYYWREGKKKPDSIEENVKNLEKCFCPCKSRYRCVACSDYSGCTENI